MVATKSLLCIIVGSLALATANAQPPRPRQGGPGRQGQSECRTFLEENCDCQSLEREERGACVSACLTGNTEGETACATLIEHMATRQKCRELVETECTDCADLEDRSQEKRECVRTCLQEHDTEGECQKRGGMGKRRKGGEGKKDGDRDGKRGPHKGDRMQASEECREFVEETCECERPEGMGKPEGMDDAQERRMRQADDDGDDDDDAEEEHKGMGHKGMGHGDSKRGEYRQCVRECIEANDSDDVCARKMDDKENDSEEVDGDGDDDDDDDDDEEEAEADSE